MPFNMDFVWIFLLPTVGVVMTLIVLFIVAKAWNIMRMGIGL
jgi:hypothetical protein